jgi:ribosome maturation factor RimP
MAPSPTRILVAKVRELAEPLAELRGCEVVGVEAVGSASGKRVLRISIDKVGGATIEDCTRVSRSLSPALDAEDIIAHAYDLEVGTPGMERPLQREKDWVQFIGCACRVKTWDMDGRRRLRGVIRGCEGGVVRLDTDGGPREIPLEEIDRANLVLDFEQYTRLGQGLHPLAEGETP